jgi:hypothetical protein
MKIKPEDHHKYEYFSKLYQAWKPLLPSDSAEKLLKSGYQIRLKQNPS